MISRLPTLVALALIVSLGVFLLNLASAQARDTTRKHHLEDIEQSLYLARSLHGTYPPYDLPSWCGRLNAPENSLVRSQLEAALRAQNEQYDNPNKPFPRDPLLLEDYFYWKRSPAIFELYAILETDRNGERSTSNCTSAPGLMYDYGLTSVWREN